MDLWLERLKRQLVPAKFCALNLQSFAIVRLLQFSDAKSPKTPRPSQTDPLGIMKMTDQMSENTCLAIEKNKN
jgi:hypothetical protein